ncbi:MAG TPA: glycosyltransferase family 4 protein [Tepidiformaceae bacterium]
MQNSILLITQVYAPDPAAVARLMADVGTSLARRGNKVTVLTADRGYDNPAMRYPSLTTSEGIVIRRLSFSSFGKRNLLLRTLAGVSFTLQSALYGLTIRGLDGVVVTTSPPMGALAGVILGALRGVRVVYWPMDLNPDQTLALKLVSEDAPVVRLLEWLNRAILRRAVSVVALDRFMAERLEAKVTVADKIEIVPPWPEHDDVEQVEREVNPFVATHGLDGKTVVMYSGTLGPSNPVDTLLIAAERFEHDPTLVFVFVGGGTGMQAVRLRGRPNVICLPYESLDRMRFSLAAADVHIVSLGESMVGIVHPCKVYGAMAAARPILFLGPEQSHVSDLMRNADIGWHVRHGDVDAGVAAIQEILNSGAARLRTKGERASAIISRSFTRRVSCDRLCEIIERAVRQPSAVPPQGVIRSADSA